MIKIRNLKKKFGHSVVLNGVNLDVEEGETLVILGRSGTGKSVLLKHIAGISEPDEGSIEVNGICISKLSKMKSYEAAIQMGMLFQGAALFDSLNVENNVSFFLHQHGDIHNRRRLSVREIKHRALEALERVGLKGVENKMPSELSGGMRKRVALARLLIYHPRIILYDEPTTGLDPITSYQIDQLIKNIQQELKATGIVVSHDIGSSVSIGDRLALMDQGEILYIDKPQAFMNIQHPMIICLKNNMPRGFQHLGNP